MTGWEKCGERTKKEGKKDERKGERRKKNLSHNPLFQCMSAPVVIAH